MYWGRMTLLSGAVNSVGSQGLPLGVTVDMPIEDVVEFEFPPGDAIVLASDGFFEWQNADGQQFGTSRLTQVIQDHVRERADDVIRAMDEAVSAHVGPVAQDDDMTAVVIRCVG